MVIKIRVEAGDKFLETRTTECAVKSYPTMLDNMMLTCREFLRDNMEDTKNEEGSN
ncbi:hypothetical protein D3C81_2056830 [compost metagenome]